MISHCEGFFYLIVGTLALTQCLFCLLFVCGAWNMLMGSAPTGAARMDPCT